MKNKIGKKRDFNCPICQLENTTSGLLRIHLVKHFYPAMKEARPDIFMTRRCEKCERTFVNQFAAYRHVALAHGLLDEVLTPEISRYLEK